MAKAKLLGWESRSWPLTTPGIFDHARELDEALDEADPYNGEQLSEQLSVGVYFERLAVTAPQIGIYQLSTRPTKQSDSRARNFTGESVEVDAIRPSALRELVEDAITRHVDPEALRLTRLAEDSEREILQRMRGAP